MYIALTPRKIIIIDEMHGLKHRVESIIIVLHMHTAYSLSMRVSSST